MRAEECSETIVQVGGNDPAMRPQIAVLVKRTYRLVHGRALVSDVQLPMRPLEWDDSVPGHHVLYDADIYSDKELTDVVVLGHAYARPGTRRGHASIRVGPVHKRLEVFGDRKVASSRDGRIVFSEPEPFERMPVTKERAYGGRDAVTEREWGNPYELLEKQLGWDAAAHSPFAYPRNRAGRGYLVTATAQACEALELPNLEDPAGLLAPHALAVGHPGRWPTMPLPWFLGWTHLAEFPRIAFAGSMHPCHPNLGPLPEVGRGFVPPDFPRLGKVEEVYTPRFWNGASLGLALGPFTQEVQTIELELENLHPREPRLRFTLPPGRPRIWTGSWDGTLTETKPKIHHVVIEPDEDRVSVVWGGKNVAPRPYMAEELLAMPLRVEWD